MSASPETCSSCWSVALVGTHIPRSPGGHRVEPGARGQPAVSDHLVDLEARHGSIGQFGGEEPRVEAARHDRRRGPVGDRRQQVRPQPHAEILRDAADRHVAAQQRPASFLHARGRRRRIGEEDARFLEQLAEGGDVARERGAGLHLAAKRRRGLGRRKDGPRERPRLSVAVVDPAAREHMEVAGEHHRRRAVGQQQLRTRGSRPQEHDGRGRPRRRSGRQATPVNRHTFREAARLDGCPAPSSRMDRQRRHRPSGTASAHRTRASATGRCRSCG